MKFIFRHIFPLLFIHVLFAQNNYVNYSVKDGLPSTRSYRMIQDKRGNMWFATNLGLSRFDGTTFKNFTYKDGLPNQDVWELYVDDKNRVWFFTKNKLQGYVKDNKVFVFPNSLSLNLSPNTFFGDGVNLFINTKNYYYQFEDTIFNKMDFSLIDWNSDKNYWLTVVNPIQYKLANIHPNHIEFFDLSTNESTIVKNYSYKSKITTLTSSHTFKLGSISTSVVYAFTNYGFFIIDFSKNKVWYFSAKDLFNTNEFNRAAKFDVYTNRIYLSYPGSILVFDYEFNIIDKYNFQDKYPDNINSYIDKDGNFWHNNESGIAFESANQHIAKHYLRGLRIHKIGFIDDDLYASTIDNLYQLDKVQNTFLPTNFKIGFTNRIKSNERIIVKEQELYKKTNDNRWEELNLKVLNSNKRFLKDFIHFKKHKYYISDEGVAISDDLNSSVKRFNTININQAIVFQNRVYFGGSDGLSVYNNQSILPIFINKFNYPIASFKNIGNHLLIGTKGVGIYSFDGKYLNKIVTTDGLLISKMIKDHNEDNVIWFSSQNGIKRLQLKGKNNQESIVTNTYTTDEGLLSDNINDFTIKDSVLYTASDLGITQINLRTKSFYKPVKIRFNTDENRLFIPKNNKQNIRISFSAEDFVRSNSTAYFYRLLPESKNWIPVNNKEIIFNQLNHGVYKLEVKSKTLHNVEYNIFMFLEVEPYWWENVWIIVIFILLLASAIALIVKFFYRRFKHNYKKKIDQDKKLTSLELQALRSQMNPHFVHNSLNAIQYFIQRNDVEQSENYLSKFSKLIRMFFEFSSKQLISIQDEINLLEHYLQIEKMRFEEKISFEIIYDKLLWNENPKIPSMIVQPIIENAVNHGIFHKKEKGNIIVTFKKIKTDLLEVTIDDDGIGYKKSIEINQERIAKDKKSSSKVIQERINLLNQSNHYIHYQITDKSEISENDQGTIVTLQIAISNTESYED